MWQEDYFSYRAISTLTYLIPTFPLDLLPNFFSYSSAENFRNI